MNRKAKYNLEKDLKDKGAAFAIDKHNAELRNNSAGLRVNPGSVKINAK
jgi:tektin-1